MYRETLAGETLANKHKLAQPIFIKFSHRLSHENTSAALDIENVNPEVLQTHIKGFGYSVQGVTRSQWDFEQDCTAISTTVKLKNLGK